MDVTFPGISDGKEVSDRQHASYLKALTANTQATKAHVTVLVGIIMLAFT